MNGIEYIGLVGAVLVAGGGLTFCWRLLIELKESIKSKVIGTLKGSPGVRANVNRWSRQRCGMHYGENIVEPQGFPTTRVTEDGVQWVSVETDQDGYILPTEEPPISKTKAGIHFSPGIGRLSEEQAIEASWHNWVQDNDAAIKNLEANATLADTQRWEMARQIESLVKNEGNMITVLEKMADSMLARDKRIAELEDRLRDSIFILYGGKKPDVE